MKFKSLKRQRRARPMGAQVVGRPQPVMPRPLGGPLVPRVAPRPGR